LLLRLRGWLIDYLGEKETTIDAAKLTVKDLLTIFDKGDEEILRAVDERRIFISVNSNVVYDLTMQLSDDDLVTLSSIGSGG